MLEETYMVVGHFAILGRVRFSIIDLRLHIRWCLY